MILKDEEVDARLVSPSNLLNQLKEKLNQSSVTVKPYPKGGRKEGDTAIPPLVRELISSLAQNEDQSSVADAFGVSQPTVSGASRGLVGDRKEFEVNDVKRDEAHELALDCLMSSLGALSPALEKAKVDQSISPTKLSRIAADMSKIATSIKGDKNSGTTNNTQVIIMAPTQKKLSDFDFIEA